MTDNEINAAIAEACGWKHVRGYHWKNPNGLSMFEWDMFDYCNDLNAMHEAEKALAGTNMFVMGIHIERLVSRHGQHYFHATARERAEAFLRTLGKWEEMQE